MHDSVGPSSACFQWQVWHGTFALGLSRMATLAQRPPGADLPPPAQGRLNARYCALHWGEGMLHVPAHSHAGMCVGDAGQGWATRAFAEKERAGHASGRRPPKGRRGGGSVPHPHTAHCTSPSAAPSHCSPLLLPLLSRLYPLRLALRTTRVLRVSAPPPPPPLSTPHPPLKSPPQAGGNRRLGPESIGNTRRRRRQRKFLQGAKENFYKAPKKIFTRRRS